VKDSVSVIGVDIGGTHLKLGRFDSRGAELQSLMISTPHPAIPEQVLQAVKAAIAQLDPQDNSHAIGIGTPGPADPTGRIARLAINLPDWINVPVADWIEAKLGKPCTIANDANCAGMGEAWLGAGRSRRDFVLLTLGTGVGGAIILNQKLFVGQGGAAGELGSMSFDPNGHLCNSGNRGSVEQQLCIRAIERRTGKTPEILGKLAQQGDPEALAFWQAYGRDLGIAAATLIYILTPEAIVIGGGISASSDFFFPAALSEIYDRVNGPSRGNVQLLRAELGNRAGSIGAAKLALDLINPL
jgi:glucokinase